MGIENYRGWLVGRPAAITSLVLTVLLALLFALYVPEALAVRMGYSGPAGMFALDMNLWPPSIPHILTDYRDAGRHAMIVSHLGFDFVFPAAYGVLLFNILVRVRLCGGTTASALPLLFPIVAALADCLENVGLILLATTYPMDATAVVWLTGLFTWIKFAALMAAVTAAFWLGFRTRLDVG